MTGRLIRCIKEAKKIGLKGKSVLDVGCSFGWFCQVAITEGALKVCGIDPSSSQISIARRNIQNAEFKKGTANKIPYNPNSFELVTLFDVIEHVPKGTETQVLKQVHKVLKPSGYLLISTPYSNPIACLTDPAFYFGHRHYTAKGLSKLAAKSGLQVRFTQTYGGAWEVIAMWVLYISKWIFRTKMPAEEWFDKKRRKEFNSKGWTHLFLVAQKSTTK